MRTRILLGSVLLALSLSPTTAFGGEACDRAFDVVGHIFEMSDSDGSGTLSRAEYDAAGLHRYGVSFEGYDADGDGEATRDEYQDLYDRHHLAEGEIES